MPCNLAIALILFEAEAISLLELQDITNWSPAFRFISFYPHSSQSDLFKMINRCLTSLLKTVHRDFLLNTADQSKVFTCSFLEVQCKYSKEMSLIVLIQKHKKREETKYMR